jgi:hypothetical protein
MWLFEGDINPKLVEEDPLSTLTRDQMGRVGERERRSREMWLPMREF